MLRGMLLLLLGFLSTQCHGQAPPEVTADEDFETYLPSAVANRDLVSITWTL